MVVAGEKKAEPSFWRLIEEVDGMEEEVGFGVGDRREEEVNVCLGEAWGRMSDIVNVSTMPQS